MPQTEPMLIKVPEAAKMLSISQAKLWQLIKAGEVPVVRIGRSVRFLPDDLRHWAEARRTFAAPSPERSKPVVHAAS